VKLLSWPVRSLCFQSATIVGKRLGHQPNTCSLWPAKSTVLTPRVCCWMGAATALVDRDTTGRLAGAETKLRFGTAGAATFCFEARRAVRANDLDAILCGEQDNGKQRFVGSYNGVRVSQNSSCEAWGNFWSRGLPDASKLPGPAATGLVGLAARRCTARVQPRFLALGTNSDHRPICLSSLMWLGSKMKSS